MAQNAAFVAVGFALYRFAVSYMYGSELGVHSETIGFVSNLTFVFTTNIVSCLCAAITLLVQALRHTTVNLNRPWLACVFFTAGVLCSQLVGTGLQLPGGVFEVALGILCGMGLFILTTTWLNVFIAQGDARQMLRSITGGLVLYTVVDAALASAPGVIVAPVALVALAGSAYVARVVLAKAPACLARPVKAALFDSREAVPVYICFFVLVGVVGIMHTSVIGSSSEFIIGSVPMWLTRVIALVVFVLIVLVMGQHFSLGRIFKTVFPLFIATMTLLPFIGGEVGAFAGLYAIIAYCICGMLFNLFLIREGRRLQLPGTLLASVYTLGSSGCLIAGLCIGFGLSYASVSLDLSLLTLLAFATIYPLSIVLVWLVRRDDRRGRAIARDADAAAGDADHVALRQDDEHGIVAGAPFDNAIAALAGESGLTRRECEVVSYIARGYTARYIAEALVISENTAWTHVKHIYAKTKTHSREELMDLVAARIAHAQMSADK